MSDQLPKFVHLHLHSEYSLMDGILTIPKLIAAAIQAKMPAVALTDYNNLFALIRFYQAAQRSGIKPIVGVDLLLQSDDQQGSALFTLLCQDLNGYRNLTRLLSRAYIEGQERGFPQVRREWLAHNSDGLIVLSGGRAGDIGRALLSKRRDEAIRYLDWWQTNFPGRYYLELVRTGRADEDEYLQLALELALERNLLVVATNDVRFLSPTDFEVHETRVCIHDGNILSDPRRPHLYSEEQYFKTQEEMSELFADIPEALENSVLIAQRCNLSLPLGKFFLPEFPLPPGFNSTAEYLQQQANLGLKNRCWKKIDSQKFNVVERQRVYQERLDLELRVITQMNFAGYFLIVADFIHWAKKQGIPVGPGRGSGAGSLVAYALSITDVDPILYDLLFERFLNPERVSLPDFDIDFCMDRRDEVINYVMDRYGRDRVAQIITYGTMSAKAVVRDVGRVLNHPYGFVDAIAKLIPFELGITLDDALRQEDELRRRYDLEEEVHAIINRARQLEGLTRNVGRHAGGVVIAPEQLTNFTPLYCEPNGNSLITQFDKDDLEHVGLVKFDFLGLRTLTIIDWAVKTINQTIQEPLDISTIPLDDAATFKLLQDTNTTAVFQLESRGMRELIKRLRPDSLDDIVALVALFRPGPLQSGMVEDFIKRKHGDDSVTYPHPDLAPVLQSTYGVILYQEQVMQIAQILAGYTLGGADLLRRAMGKKKPEEMAKQREIFVKGAANRGVSSGIATSIFNLMEKFAGYGFNKSHSVAYALISYQTAWLKVHYPAAFMAAVLSSDMDNTDKVVSLINECRNLNLTVIPPNVNQSNLHFTIRDPKTIIYGLGAVKGLGTASINGIVAARKSGLFRDLFDFCRRIDARKTNRRTIEALIRSGALDCLNTERAILLHNLDRALQSAERHLKDALQGQFDLFGLQATPASERYEDAPPLDMKERLTGEKETLGLYLTGHPIDQYREDLGKIITMSLNDLRQIELDKTVCVAGLIIGMRAVRNRRGAQMAFITIDDRSARLEITLFSDLYLKWRERLEQDDYLIVIAEGRVSNNEFTNDLRMEADELFDLEGARERFTKAIKLRIHQPVAPNLVNRLTEILTPFRGGRCPIHVDYCNHEACAILVFGQKWSCRPATELLTKLRDFLGAENVTGIFETK